MMVKWLVICSSSFFKKRHRRPMACWESPLGSPAPLTSLTPALTAASSCASSARDPGGDSDKCPGLEKKCRRRKNIVENGNDEQERVENAETNLQVVDGRGRSWRPFDIFDHLTSRALQSLQPNPAHIRAHFCWSHDAGLLTRLTRPDCQAWTRRQTQPSRPPQHPPLAPPSRLAQNETVEMGNFGHEDLWFGQKLGAFCIIWTSAVPARWRRPSPTCGTLCRSISRALRTVTGPAPVWGGPQRCRSTFLNVFRRNSPNSIYSNNCPL